MKGGFEELNAKLEAATVGLVGVSRKRVFGRNTFFVDGKLFALVWREGRIGLKLPDASTHAELASVSDAAPWVAWGRPMAGWLLVPEAMHQAAAVLASWVKRSCENVRAAAPAATNEAAATRIEPLPSPPKISIKVSAPPPLPARARSVPSPAIPSVPVRAPSLAPAPSPSNGVTAISAVPAPMPAAPSATPSAEASDAAGEFSFDDPEAQAAPSAPEIVEPVQAAIETPPPSAPASEEGEGAEAFSFDAPEPRPVIANESQEFDFGAEPEPAPAAAPDATKKKKSGKGKKRAG